jgi:acyl-CoA reductase-like NAD-dependent aldehyde dehydrogenase
MTTATGTAPIFIGGDWVDTDSESEVTLPYDGSLVSRVANAGPEHVEAACAAARRAAAAMAEMTNAERSGLLMRLHSVVQRDLPLFAQDICLETGKPISEARVEVERSLQTILAAATEALRLSGEAVPIDAHPMGKGRMAMTVREPVGVIAAITPFNFPLNLGLHKIAPALAAGNTVVHKPSEQTPLSALRLAGALAEAGAPAGAYNVVTGGAAVGQQMATSDDVNMVTFTGSVPTGRKVREMAGLKKVTLELGNNSAVVLEPDTNQGEAVGRCVQAGFAHSGQVCISLQRIYVHEDIADSFLTKFTEAASRLKMGDPREESTSISSLISEQAAQRVESWIDEAIAGRAKRLLGGPRKRATVPPTILTDVPADARISCQEVFGPVVAVYRYSDLDDAIRRVNATPFGLQAGIYTQNLTRAFQAARRFQVGGVLINDVPMFRADHMPYGGVKESGIGREGPRYAIEEMTELKLICWKI